MKKVLFLGLVIGILIGFLSPAFNDGPGIAIFYAPVFGILFSPLFWGCSGEGCWGIVILTAFFESILFWELTALFVYFNVKHFIKKQKNENTKWVVIYNIFFIGLIVSSSFVSLKNICLSSESCIITIANFTKSDSICNYVFKGTEFVFDKKLYESGALVNAASFGKDACYVKLALINNDESLCIKSEIKNECYLQLSRIVKDATLCSKIQTGEYLDDIHKIYSQLDQDFCYKNNAVLTNNISKCDAIQSNDIKELCLAILEKDENHCNNISKSEFMYSKTARIECKNYFK